MSYSSYTLLGVLNFFLLKKVSGFTCRIEGRTVNCPAFVDESWCCYDRCCSFDDYTKEKSVFPTGFVIAFIFICIIVFTCGCYHYIARRRAKARCQNGLNQTVCINPPDPQAQLLQTSDANNSVQVNATPSAPYLRNPPYPVTDAHSSPPLLDPPYPVTDAYSSPPLLDPPYPVSVAYNSPPLPDPPYPVSIAYNSPPLHDPPPPYDVPPPYPQPPLNPHYRSVKK